MTTENNDGQEPEASPAAQAPILNYSSFSEDPSLIAGRRWVNFWTAQNTFDANLVVNALDAENIPARVDMENSAALGHWGVSGPGGTQVQVPAALLDDARKVLEAIEQRKAERLLVRSVKCPQCGVHPAKRLLHPFRKWGIAAIAVVPVILIVGSAADFGREAVSLTAIIAVVLGFALLLIPAMPRWLCLKCGYRWPMPDPEVDEDDEEDD